MGAEPPVIAGRVPPHDLDAEAAVLSAVMLDAHALDSVLDVLEPDHFYSDANRFVYEAGRALAAESVPVDAVSVGSWLRDRQRLQQVGGSRYLAQLVDATPAVAHVGAHARVIRDKWRVRRLIATCQRYAAAGYGDYGAAQQFIDAAEQAIYEVARTHRDSTVKPLGDVLTRAFRELGEATARGDEITGLPTGFVDLDRLTAGLHKGELLVVAARPGMGKTAFVLNVAVRVAAWRRGYVAGPGEPAPDGALPADAGPAVAIFSLEMPDEQIAKRIVCSEARVDLAKMRTGHLSQQDWVRLTDAASVVSRLPLWVDDSPGLGLLELRAKVRRLQAELRKRNAPGSQSPDIGLIIVDYLQLMKGRPGASSREQEISEISRGLKHLAKECDVPVVALSQLNRGVETRAGKEKRPILADLRESGAIEQDADTIIFIYRDEYYNQQTSTPGVAELIIAKQRNGPTGKVLTRFRADCTRFDSLARGDIEAA